jgi:hypothetical protein
VASAELSRRVGKVVAYAPLSDMSDLQVILDANLPTNLGAGTNQDAVIVTAAAPNYLWELPEGPVTRVYEEVLSGNLTIRLQRARIGHMQGGKWDNEGVAFHSFRRACGSLLVNAGMDLKQVQQRLRHAQLATTLACYVEEVDSGRSAADDGWAFWGNRGDTEHPQTAANEGAPKSPESAFQSPTADSHSPGN